MKTPHTSAYRGKRVHVVLKNGQSFVDKFVEKTGRYVRFRNVGKVIRGDIKAFTIVKGACETSPKY